MKKKFRPTTSGLKGPAGFWPHNMKVVRIGQKWWQMKDMVMTITNSYFFFRSNTNFRYSEWSKFEIWLLYRDLLISVNKTMKKGLPGWPNSVQIFCVYFTISKVYTLLYFTGILSHQPSSGLGKISNHSKTVDFLGSKANFDRPPPQGKW